MPLLSWPQARQLTWDFLADADSTYDKAAVFRDTVKPTVVSHNFLSQNFKLYCSSYCHFPNTVCLNNLNFTHAHSSYCKSLICSHTVHTDIHDTVYEQRHAQCKQWHGCSEVTVHHHKCTPMSSRSADECNLNVTPSTTRLLPGTAPIGSSDIRVCKIHVTLQIIQHIARSYLIPK